MTEQEARQFFSDFYFGEHHFPGKLKEFGHGWSMNHRSDLATYDFNHLTRLVVMAHDRCIRVQIEPLNMGYLRIAIHNRERDTGNISTQHPSLEAAILFIRERLVIKTNPTG